MTILKYLLVLVCSYLLGSVSVSIFISKNVLRADVRTKGSGNAGATNMARVYGLHMGLVTLAGDALKGAVSMLLGWLLLGECGMSAAAVSCILGHCYPAMHEFRGGKGVSVGAMVLIMADWRVLAVAVVFFALAAVLSRKVSLGSLSAALSGLVAAIVLHLSTPRLIMVAFAVLLVVVRHRENIARLIKRTEPDFSIGSTKTAQTAADKDEA